MCASRVEIQGQNFKFLFTVREEVLGDSTENLSSFKDLETIMVFLHSFGALTMSPKGGSFCSTKCFSANMK